MKEDPLLETLSRVKEKISRAIDNEWVPFVRHNSPNTINERLTEPHFSQNQASGGPKYPFIHFVHIKLDDNITTFIRFLYLMNDILSQHDILKNASIFNKIWLIERNQVRKDRSKSLTQQIKDDLASEVTETNGSELTNFVRMVYFSD